CPGAMSGDMIECAVIRLPVKTPKAGLAGIGQAGRKLVAQEPEQPKYHVTGTGCVRHDFGGIETGLLLQQALQNVNRIPERPGHDNTMKTGIFEFIPIKPLAATGSSAPGSCAGHGTVPSPD